LSDETLDLIVKASSPAPWMRTIYHYREPIAQVNAKVLLELEAAG
jgi:hypothetical protein